LQKIKDMSHKDKNQQLTPIKYIQTKLKDLPFFCCYATETWRLSFELVTLIVSRVMPSGNICMALYLIDKGCLGLKNCYYQFNISESAFFDFIEEIEMRESRKFEEISVEEAHNLVFAALDYADELGFKPDKDWSITKYFLNENLITEDIDDIPFGRDGKPFFFAGPFDNVAKVLATLKRSVGEGNFDYFIPID
jgi:hypothetical protein